MTKELREFWDSTAGTKKFTTPFQLGVFERLVPRGARVLDIGCGYGRTLSELAAAGYRETYGVDYSQKLLTLCRQNVPTAELRLGDAAALPFEADSFDAALLLGVLTCVPEDDRQRMIAAEARRVLRVGGLLYVCDFLLNDDTRNLQRYARFSEKYGYGRFELSDGAVLRHHRIEDIRALFAEFETESFTTTTFQTMNGHVSNGFSLLARKTN